MREFEPKGGIARMRELPFWGTIDCDFGEEEREEERDLVVTAGGRSEGEEDGAVRVDGRFARTAMLSGVMRTVKQTRRKSVFVHEPETIETVETHSWGPSWRVASSRCLCSVPSKLNGHSF